MKLHIKNMVSISCKVVLQTELEKLGLTVVKVDLGEVEIKEELSQNQLTQLRTSISKFGFEFINDRKSLLVEKIKNAIIELVRHTDEPSKINPSNYLSQKLKCNYTYLSNTFSEDSGTTIQQHIIDNKIEHAKELLSYGELNITEIAYKLNYSSVAHLSNQFKKVTGFSPTHYRDSHQYRAAC